MTEMDPRLDPVCSHMGRWALRNLVATLGRDEVDAREFCARTAYGQGAMLFHILAGRAKERGRVGV